MNAAAFILNILIVQIINILDGPIDDFSIWCRCVHTKAGNDLLIRPIIVLQCHQMIVERIHSCLNDKQTNYSIIHITKKQIIQNTFNLCTSSIRGVMEIWSDCRISPARITCWTDKFGLPLAKVYKDVLWFMIVFTCAIAPINTNTMSLSMMNRIYGGHPNWSDVKYQMTEIVLNWSAQHRQCCVGEFHAQFHGQAMGYAVLYNVHVSASVRVRVY